MSVKTAGVGHFTIPTAPAAGTSCTSGAANVFTTTYVQLIASTAAALYITGIYVEEAAVTAGTYIVVQLATGAAASETIVGQYLIAPSTGSTVTHSYRPIFPPIPVAISTRIACKTADSVGSQAKLITLECIAQSNVVDDGIAVGTVTTVTNQLTAAAIATGVWQDATAGDFTTASSIGKCLFISNVAPGAAGGHFIAGTNAATTITTGLTTTFTGNLTGSVGSVTGAVGSVTGAVGSVTGAVGSVTGAVGSVTAAVTVGTISANVITAASIAADAGTEIGTAVWATATRELTAGTNIVLAKGTGVTGFTDLSAAQVNAECDTAIVDAALATAANLATVAGYLDTEIAAILVDTNELQTDWADGGRLDLILDARASQASVTTVDAVVDAIQVKTDSLSFTVAGQVDSNVTHLNDTELDGNGSTTPWGPV